MKPARDEEVVEKIRQSILDSALGIIIKDGFSSFTMRRLAEGLLRPFHRVLDKICSITQR